MHVRWLSPLCFLSCNLCYAHKNDSLHATALGYTQNTKQPMYRSCQSAVRSKTINGCGSSTPMHTIYACNNAATTLSFFHAQRDRYPKRCKLTYRVIQSGREAAGVDVECKAGVVLRVPWRRGCIYFFALYRYSVIKHFLSNTFLLLP